MPGVEESVAYGTPVLKVRGKIMAGIPVKRKDVEPGTLGICVDMEGRAELLAAAPDVYYLTPHYEPGNWVLVRMACIDRDVLRDLIGMAHKLVTRSSLSRPPAKRRRTGTRK